MNGLLVGKDPGQGKRFCDACRRSEFLCLQQCLDLVASQGSQLNCNVAETTVARSLAIQDDLDQRGLEQTVLDRDHADRFSDVAGLARPAGKAIRWNSLFLNQVFDKRMNQAAASFVEAGFPLPGCPVTVSCAE